MRAHTITRIVVGAGVAAVTLGVGTAHADPPQSPNETAVLECDNGESYEITTARGNGNFTPAMDLNSTTVFVPVSFGIVSGFFDPAGDPPPQFFEDEPVAKGNGEVPAGREELNCSFVFQFADESGMGMFSGTVTGFATGGK